MAKKNWKKSQKFGFTSLFRKIFSNKVFPWGKITWNLQIPHQFKISGPNSQKWPKNWKKSQKFGLICLFQNFLNIIQLHTYEEFICEKTKLCHNVISGIIFYHL